MLMRILWQSTWNIVVIALLRHEDMHLQTRPGGRVKGTHRNGRGVFPDWISEQDRAANGAEAPAYLF